MSEFELKLYTIRRIDVLPFARMIAAVHAIIGFLIGSVASLGALAKAEGGSEILFGPLSFLLLPLINLILGFIGGALIAVTYNACASFLGGIQIRLNE